MVNLHSIPNWFYGFNIAFEIIFMLATAAVAFYAFKIYRLSYQKESKLFGLSFAFLAISYFILALANLFFLSIAEANTLTLSIARIADLKNITVALYIGFFIVGLTTLLYTTLKTERIRIYGILVLLTFTAINFSFNKVFMIYFISSLFFLFITYHYFTEYAKKKNTKVLLVLLGMVFLLLSNAIFLSETAQTATYVLSHILELIGYSFIIFSLVKILKDGKKKK